MGFGLFANYNNNDMSYKVQWYIDDTASEEYLVNFNDSDKDPEKKWFEFYIT